MLKFIDEKENEYLVQAEFQTTNGVNGERSISGTIHSNDKVIHAIGRGWKLEHEAEFYKIIYALPVDDGKNVVVEFDAVHQFFFDFGKSVKHAELNGSNTFDKYLKFIFDGSGYAYTSEVKVDAFEKQNFGFKNRLSLFNDIVKSVGVEFSVSGKVVRILDKVGTDLSTIVKKDFNLQELRLEHNIGDFITYKKGYGAYFDEEDHSKGRLEVEYKSPLASIYGILEGDSVIDERYSVRSSLLTRLKNEVDNSYSVAVSLTMEDLNEAGYEQERPHAGDYIMAINKDLGFEERVRIVSFISSYDVDSNLIDHEVSCNSLSMSSQKGGTNDSWKAEIEAGLENAKKDANHALVSANGKNMSFYGLFGSDGKGEPKATKEGDTWFKPVGEETVVYTWDGKAWIELMSTKDNKIIQNKIEEVETEVEKSKKDSDKALKEAEESRKQADEARKQAFNSEQLANSAKQDAILAIQKGDGNATEIKKLENGMQLTNSKVDGNTAQISTLKSTNEQLSSTIMKTQADLENMDTSNLLINSKGDNINGYTGWGGSSLSILEEAVYVKNNDTLGSYGVQTPRLKLERGVTYTIQVDTGSYFNTNQLNYCYIIYSDGSSQNIGTIKINAQDTNLRTQILKVIPDKDDAECRVLFGVDVRIEGTKNSTGFRIRKIKISQGVHNIKPWTPSIFDFATQTEFSSFVQTSKGFQQTTQSDITGLRSQQTQLGGQITSIVETYYKVTEETNLLSINKIDNSSNKPEWFVIKLGDISSEPNNYYTASTNIPYRGAIPDAFITTSLSEVVQSTVNGFGKDSAKTVKAAGTSVYVYIRNDSIKNKLLSGEFWIKVQKGQKATAWSPAPEDNASQTQITQLKDQIDLNVKKTETVDGRVTQQQSQINVLSNNISLKVDKDKVVTQINLSPENIRLNAKWIHLSGTSLIDNAVIKSAHIADAAITTAKIQNASISSAKIINVDASKVVANTLSAITTNTGALNVTGWINIKTENLGLVGTYDFEELDEYGGVTAAYPRKYVGDWRLSHRHLFFKNNQWAREPNYWYYHGYGESFYGGNYFKSRRYNNESEKRLMGRIDIRDDFVQVASTWGDGSGTIIKPWGVLSKSGRFGYIIRKEGWNNIYIDPDLVPEPNGEGNIYSDPWWSGMVIGEDGDGKRVLSSYIYRRTYQGGNNVVISDSGTLGRAISARKYKKNIRTADDVIKKAKKVLDISPSVWNNKMKETDKKDYFGFIADEFDEAGLKEVVLYNSKNEVESLAYERIPMYHNVILNEHEKEIIKLKNKVKELESALYA